MTVNNEAIIECKNNAYNSMFREYHKTGRGEFPDTKEKRALQALAKGMDSTRTCAFSFKTADRSLFFGEFLIPHPDRYFPLSEKDFTVLTYQIRDQADRNYPWPVQDRFGAWFVPSAEHGKYGCTKGGVNDSPLKRGESAEMFLDKVAENIISEDAAGYGSHDLAHERQARFAALCGSYDTKIAPRPLFQKALKIVERERKYMAMRDQIEKCKSEAWEPMQEPKRKANRKVKLVQRCHKNKWNLPRESVCLIEKTFLITADGGTEESNLSSVYYGEIISREGPDRFFPLSKSDAEALLKQNNGEFDRKIPWPVRDSHGRYFVPEAPKGHYGEEEGTCGPLELVADTTPLTHITTLEDYWARCEARIVDDNHEGDSSGLKSRELQETYAILYRTLCSNERHEGHRAAMAVVYAERGKAGEPEAASTSSEEESSDAHSTTQSTHHSDSSTSSSSPSTTSSQPDKKVKGKKGSKKIDPKSASSSSSSGKTAAALALLVIAVVGVGAYFGLSKLKR